MPPSLPAAITGFSLDAFHAHVFAPGRVPGSRRRNRRRSWACSLFPPPRRTRPQPAAGRRFRRCSRRPIAQPDWEKVCGKINDQQECHTSRKRLAATGQPIAQFLVIERGDKKLLQLAVPPVALIQPGVQVKIDDAEPTGVKYVVCTPGECLALGEINDDFVGEAQEGRSVVITMLNPQGKPVNFDISLVGFTSIYDGPGIDPQEAQVRQQRLEDELKKKADEARQQLLQLSSSSSRAARSSSSSRRQGFRRGRPAAPFSVRHVARAVDALLEALEEIANLRMADRLAAFVGQKILLGDVGDVFGLLVLGEQMIKRLILRGPDLLGDRLIPFLGVGEDRVHVEDDAAEREEAVPHDLADAEFRLSDLHGLEFRLSGCSGKPRRREREAHSPPK